MLAAEPELLELAMAGIAAVAMTAASAPSAAAARVVMRFMVDVAGGWGEAMCRPSYGGLPPGLG